MECLWNDSFEFVKMPVGSDTNDLLEADWQPVCIPHDWLIYDTTHLYQDNDGWYRKRFTLPLGEKRFFLSFDGVYMNSTFYLNGKQIFEWKYGYSPFVFEITKELCSNENELLVRVRYQSPNSRWYSGAGIYRNVRLITKEREYLEIDGNYVHTEKNGNDYSITIQTGVIVTKNTERRIFDARKEDGTELFSVCHKLETGDGQEVCLTPVTKEKINVSCYHSPSAEQIEFKLSEEDCPVRNEQFFTVKAPKEWSTNTPYLYRLTTVLLHGGKELDRKEQKIGFRTFTFSPEQGLFQNGEHLKIKGVCEHHDLGCLGAEFHAEAFRRKLHLLKKMGVNAIRTSHNMVAREVLSLAEEEGFLIIAESFDMWERNKTQYDYACYFDDWYKKDVGTFVRRDRNHACILFYSIGNEIYDTHVDSRGYEVTQLLISEFERHDPLHNAHLTLGTNYMPWVNTQRCADLIKYIGYNYCEKLYKDHHKEHPDWVIYGSETASTVQSRGIYRFPYSSTLLADDDEQCSSLGNASTSWGASSSESCIITERDTPYSLGQFLWSGFDYIGEPTPYNTKNSYLGQIDTAGFYKDMAYIYQAEWTDYKSAPMVHIFPYWDFSIGQLVDVRVCSNAPYVELFLNEKSKGKFAIDHAHGKQLVANYQLLYEPGELFAVATDENGTVVATTVERSFTDAVSLQITAEKKELQADSDDLAFFTIEAYDRNGNPVRNARNRVKVEVTGAGRLVGLDNGDSTDYDQYKATSRRLFSGKLLAVVAAKRESGEVKVKVSSKGLFPAEITIQASLGKQSTGVYSLPEPAPLYDNHSFEEEYLKKLRERQGEESVAAFRFRQDNEIPVRRIDMSCEPFARTIEERTLTKGKESLILKARILPENATDRRLFWRVTYRDGIDADFMTLTDCSDGSVRKSTPEGLALSEKVTLTALYDGEIRVRAMSCNGSQKPCVISDLDFTVTGMGKTFLNPYSFIYGSLYTDCQGVVTNGNERGFATSRDGRTAVSFRNVDFLEFGSDEIDLSIFELDSQKTDIEIWEGIPGEADAEKIDTVTYHKKTIWGVYQPQRYQLRRRICGKKTITFVTNRKLHMKGFRFIEKKKAFEKLYAAENNAIYGDTFTREELAVTGIGNNVTLTFSGMDFTERGADTLTICGKSILKQNSIHVKFLSENQTECKEVAEFTSKNGEEYQEQVFRFDSVKGKQTVSFVFLPGCDFDFFWFRFSSSRE